MPPGVRAREARRNGLSPDLRQATDLTGGSKARPGTPQPPRDHLPHRGGRRGLTGATGTRRRLQALMVNGWPAAGLAARAGLDAASLSRIADGAQDKVTGATADAVAHLYDRLWDRFPPLDTPGARAEAAATRAQARRRHWAPALAWDDDRIDDPAATPQGVDPGPSRAQGPVARLVDASDELLAWGYTLRQAAERLGVSRNSLERARLRRGLRQTRPAPGAIAGTHTGSGGPPKPPRDAGGRAVTARRSRRGWDTAAREEWRLHAEAQYLAAEAATRGHLLSPHGTGKGIDPRSLWAGRERAARRYASPELRAWWDQHGRLTVTQYLDQIRRDRAAGKDQYETGADYLRRRYREKAYGRWNPWADAAPVRDHVRALHDATGADYRQIAAAAGLGTHRVGHLLHGNPSDGKPPARKIRRDAAQRLLALTGAELRPNPRALVPAAGSRHRLRALVATGRPASALTAELGMGEHPVRDIISGRSGQVTAATRDAVRGLYDRLWDVPPPEHTPAQRQAASLRPRPRRTRRLATTHGPGRRPDRQPRLPAPVPLARHPTPDRRPPARSAPRRARPPRPRLPAGRNSPPRPGHTSGDSQPPQGQRPGHGGGLMKPRSSPHPAAKTTSRQKEARTAAGTAVEPAAGHTLSGSSRRRWELSRADAKAGTLRTLATAAPAGSMTFARAGHLPSAALVAPWLTADLAGRGRGAAAGSDPSPAHRPGTLPVGRDATPTIAVADLCLAGAAAAAAARVGGDHASPPAARRRPAVRRPGVARGNHPGHAGRPAVTAPACTQAGAWPRDRPGGRS